MNDPHALSLSGQLDRMLRANEAERSGIDPRTVPVRFSHLKQMALSPAHYRYAVQVDRDDTLSMRLGRGVHSLLLDRPDRVTVFTGKTRQGKVWEAFEAEAERNNREVLNQREYEVAVGIANAVRSNAKAYELLLDGTVMESRIDWSMLGRACRSTPDARKPGVLVELKTGRTSQPERFVSSATWMSYHAQLAFYRSAIRWAGGDVCEAYIVAVESAPPFPVTVLRVTERALDYGDRLVRLWFERLLQCEQSNEWPGYVQSVVEFDVTDDPRDELVFGDEDETDE